MSGDITEPFVAIQDPRSRSSSPSSSDWERPIQVSPFGQLRDGVEAILKVSMDVDNTNWDGTSGCLGGDDPT